MFWRHLCEPAWLGKWVKSCLVWEFSFRDWEYLGCTRTLRCHHFSLSLPKEKHCHNSGISSNPREASLTPVQHKSNSCCWFSLSFLRCYLAFWSNCRGSDLTTWWPGRSSVPEAAPMQTQAAANTGRSLLLGVLLIHLTSHLEGEGSHASPGTADWKTQSSHWFKWQAVFEAKSRKQVSFPAECPNCCPMVMLCPALWSKESLII